MASADTWDFMCQEMLRLSQELQVVREERDLLKVEKVRLGGMLAGAVAEMSRVSGGLDPCWDAEEKSWGYK